MNVRLDAIGILVSTNGAIEGSGCVIVPGSVMTCDHVVPPRLGLAYNFVNGLGVHLPVTVEKTIRRYDLATVRFNSTNQIAPLPIGDIRRIRPGDEVGYVGYNVLEKQLKPGAAVVSAIGVALNDGVSVDFIEFEGQGIPGYSGGPIFNHKGEVIALMREAWTKRSVRGSGEVLVNRGFAIEPAMLLKEIYFPTNTVHFTNAPGTNTISIQLELR